LLFVYKSECEPILASCWSWSSREIY